MPLRLREDFPEYELRKAEVRTARLPRPCDSPVCARHGIMIEVGTRYAYVSTGQAYCPFHWEDTDVVEVSR